MSQPSSPHQSRSPRPLPRDSRNTARGNDGYSLVELLIAVAVTGVAIISILNCFAMAGKVTTRLEESFYARWLALGLKAELDRLPVVDPDQTPRFGCESGEWDRARTTFDDLDDYQGWSVSPPEDDRGLPNEDLSGYRCAVAVRYADPDDPAKPVPPGSTEFVFCTIVVDREGKELFRGEWLRTVR